MKKLAVSSPGFEFGGLIPIEHTGYGADISPELRLSDFEVDAKSIAVIMNDMSHPIPEFNHWVIWNIPVMPVISPGVPHGKRVEALGGAIQGRGYGKYRYKGPKPPFGWSHEYQFNVYVLDCRIELPETAKKRDLIQAMQGRILQQGALNGHYK